MNKPVKTAITPTRAEDFPQWYQEVIKAADMAENSPVRGCMIIKPYGYAVWENMQRIFDEWLKDYGVQNASFPLLIPLSFLEKEAEHVEGFAKECAVVTHHRLEAGPDGKLQPAPAAKLEEPYVVRPTSETIIGDAMARWVRSYRDLPLKLNQWCNVMRWEMRTRLFLRTSEFFWHEGHCAFETPEGAKEDCMTILSLYKKFFEEYLAIPGIPGVKTAEERFPGAEETYTIETMMQDGKALQAATTHDLGQNFAKSCGIKFQGRDGTEQYAQTTSWAFTTRMIGALTMVHGDDDGIIVPPRIAPYPIIIIPIAREDADLPRIIESAKATAAKLKKIGIRVHIDDRDERTPNKMWDAIKKGVPLRVEIGGREVDEGTLTFIRRDIGKDSKKTLKVDEFVSSVQSVLDNIHTSMLEKARKLQNSRIYEMKSLADVEKFFKDGGVGFAKINTDFIQDTKFEAMKKEYSLTTRCMPLEDKGTKVLVGKAY